MSTCAEQPGTAGDAVVSQAEDKQLILAMAKRIYFFDHPRKNWQENPNFAQAAEQARYLALARTLFHQVCAAVIAEETL